MVSTSVYKTKGKGVHSMLDEWPYKPYCFPLNILMQEQKRIAFYPIIIGESVSQTREVHIILTQSHLKPNYNEHFASKMDFYKPGEVAI